jgi:riboflavin biosynthesis pyrimidine reductase
MDSRRDQILKSTFNSDSKTLYLCTKKSKDSYVEDSGTTGLFSEPHVRLALLDEHDPIQSVVSILASDEVKTFNGGVPIQSIMVEGGAKLLGLMMERDLIDLFQVFVAPAMLGGKDNRIGLMPSRSGDHAPLFSGMTRYHLVTSNQIGGDILLEFLPEERWVNIFA